MGTRLPVRDFGLRCSLVDLDTDMVRDRHPEKERVAPIYVDRIRST